MKIGKSELLRSPSQVNAVVEAVQDERTSGEGAFETPGAGAAGGCGGRDANREVGAARLVVSTAASG